MDEQLDMDGFRERGWLRVRAFSRAEAAAMVDRIWEGFESVHGVHRDDPDTWRGAYPSGLQSLREEPVFAPIGGAPTIRAIDAVLGADRWSRPRHWGQILVSFPSGEPWSVPSEIWHTDFEYDVPPEPPAGAQVFALLTDVAPGGGATPVIEGSHRVVEGFVRGRSPEELAPMKRARKALMGSDPWLRDLGAVADRDERTRRFMEEGGDVAGVRVRVAELTGDAGDVIVAHPWLLHASARNAGGVVRMGCVQRIRVSPRAATM